MPRRGEESSPAPRRSPRAAVKASASPSPIIRASRSQSAVKQSTPKTRTASPSPKAKTPTRSTKSKAKEETPKATSQRSPRTPAGKQSQGDTKKTAASSDRGSRTSARQSAAKTSSSTKAAKGRQKKTVEEEEEEEDDDDGEEEEEKEEESEAEDEPATPTTPAVKGGRGSRRKSQTEAKETPTPPPARSRSTRGQATPASADKKAQAAPATRKGRSTSASAKETAVEVADKYEEEGKLEAEEEESQNMKQTESRSRRSLGRRSEDAATPVTPEVDGSKGRRAAARSRSRGLEKKDEDEVESAPAVVEVEEPKGRASRARSRGQSKDGAGGSSSGRGDPVSKAGLEDKKGREKETAAKGAKPEEKVEEDEAQPSELPSTPDTKSRKRGATHVEKSPEVVVSPASKKKRVTKGATPAEEDKPATTEASPGKKKAKEEEEGEEATKEKEKAKEEDSKPGKGSDEAGSQPPVTAAAAVPSLLSTGSKASDRVETDMEVDESPVVKQGRTPSPKKTLSMKQTPPPPSSAATTTTTTTTTTAAAASAAISSPKKAPTTTTTTPVTVQQSTTTAAAKVATPSLSPGVTDLTKTTSSSSSSPVKPQAKPQVGVNISKEATVVKLPSPVPPVTATPAAEKKQPSESPAKCAAEDAARTVSKSESAATKSAPKASPASELAPVTGSVPKTAELPARTPASAGGGATAVAGVGAAQSTLTPKSNSETVSAKTSKDVTAAPLKGSPLKPDPVAVSGGSSAPSPAAGQTTPKPQAQPADKAAPEKTIKPLMAQPVVGAVGAANAPTIQATSAKPASISTEKTPPAPPTTPAAAAAPQTKVTSSPPSSRPCAVSSAGSLPAKSPVKSEVKPAHIPSLMSARPFSDVGHTGSAARSHNLPLHGSPAKLLPTPAKLPQGPTEGPTGSKGVEISAKPAGNSSPQAPKAMGQPSAQSSPAKAPGHTPMSTAGPKPSGTDSVSGRPSHQGPGPVVSSVIKLTDVKPSTPQQPVASRVHGEKPLGAPVAVAPTGSPLKPGQQPAGTPLHPQSTAPQNVYSKSVPPAHVSPATAAPPQRIPPLCKPTPVPTGAATPGKVTPRPNNPAAIPPLMSKPLLSSTQVPPKPVVGVTSASGPTPLMEAKTMSGAAAMDHKQNRPHFSDVGKPQASSAATIRPLLPPDATPGHPAHHSPLLKPPMSTPDLTTTPPARKTFSPAFLSNQPSAPKTASSPADAAAMSRLMGAMPPKAPSVQEGTGFSKVAGSPAAGVAASKSPGAQTVKPQVTHMTGVVTSKPAAGSVTNVSSLKPQITHMTGTVPPKVLPPSPALSKPSVTHMAGVASQKPQVTHMAGVAPPKPMMQPSDTSSPSKPVVVRAVGSVTSKPAPGQSPLAPSPAPSHGGNIPGDSDRTKSQPLPADPSRYVSPSKTADPVDMSQKPPQGAQHAPRPQGSPASHAKGFTVEQKCEQLQHSAKSAVAPEANKPKPLAAAPGNTDVKSSPVKPANSQDSFQVKSLVPDSTESRPIIVGGVGTPHKVPATTTTTTTAISSSQKPAPVTVMATTPGKGQQHTGSSVNNPAAPQLNKPPTHLATPGHHPAAVTVPPSSPSSCGPGPAGVTAATAAASPLVTSCGTSKAASVDVINGAKRSLTTAQQQQQQQSQQVCDLSKKRKADSAEEGDLRSSKKAHTAEEEAKLVANGQKLSGAPLPATTRVTSDAKVSKPESMEVSQSGSNVSDNLLAGYVVVNRGDVPPKDSAEVRQSLPKTPVANPNPSSLLKHPASTPPPPLMMSKIAAAAAGPGSSIGSSPNRDTLLSRTFIFNPELPSNTIMDKSRQFSVVSYNILADCHFSQTLKDRYPAEEKHFLELAVRHKRLMAELSYIDADVVCLQEVEPEYYSKTLSPDMQKLGYEGFYKKRVHENYDEGETTFYKTSRFSDAENTAYSLKQLIDKDIQEMSLSEEVKEAVRRFMCLPDVLLVTRLRCKNTGKFITVGNVHINWGQFKLPNVQCVQIARAIREVVNRAGSDSNPHVICGDFNSSPLTPGYQLASEGYLTDAMIQVLQSSKTMEMPDGSKSALVDHLWEGFQHTSSSLNSAYAVVQRKEPGLTTLTKHTRECLDYVFYSSTSLEAVGVLQVPSRQTVLDSQRIPNRTFPSDHLSLKAVLAFK